MMYTVIDGNCFKNMLVGAYQLFQKNYQSAECFPRAGWRYRE